MKENLLDLLDLLGNYDIEDFNTEEYIKVADAFFINANSTFTSEDIKFPNEELLIIFIRKCTTTEELKVIIEQLNLKKTKKNLEQVYIFEVSTSPFGTECNSVEKIKNIREVVQKTLNGIFSKYFSLNKITYDTFIISNEFEKQDVSISIESRIRSLEREIPLSDTVSLKGFVFSAKLADILELYNILGNTLFGQNLRYSIGDQLGVNDSIKETIETNPSEFWFLNNGISLSIEDEAQLDFSTYDRIKLTLKTDKSVSVINGAQTISASSRSKFKDSDAYVLLRIFAFSGDSSDRKSIINSELDKITVALNRQKPIRPEDVAYTYEFISQINNIQLDAKEKDYEFQVVRRGDIENNFSHKYTLINFARMTKAYLAQTPGEARSKGASTLLKKSFGTAMTFYDTSIFVEFSETSMEKSRDIFLSKYKPINFAFKLKSILDEKYLLERKRIIITKLTKADVSNESIKDNLTALVNYGRYFLIAFLIYRYNNNNNTDFSNWSYSDIREKSTKNVLSKQQLESDIEKIFTLFVEFSKSREASPSETYLLDANSFKKDEIYKKFIEFMKDKKLS